MEVEAEVEATIQTQAAAEMALIPAMAVAMVLTAGPRILHIRVVVRRIRATEAATIPLGGAAAWGIRPTTKIASSCRIWSIPPRRSASSQKEGEVDVTDDQGRKRIYLTDSRKPQKSKDANYQESSAHWDGARLVSEEKGLHGGRITRTYELTPDGKQLNESVRLDNTHTGLITVRYVFDLTSASTPALAPAAK